MPASSRRTKTTPEVSRAPLLIVAGALGACVAGWFGYPAAPALWLGLVAAAWAEPVVVLTGPKDASGRPGPADAREASQARQERFFADLRWRLVLPNSDWLPGWPPTASWFSAVLAAGAGLAIPVVVSAHLAAVFHGRQVEAVEISRLANAVAAFLVATAVPACARRSVPGGCPGVRLDSLWATWRSKTLPAAVATGLGALAGFGADVGVRIGEVRADLAAHHVAVASPALTTAVTLAGGAWLGMLAVWAPAALDRWRRVVAASAEWAPRWRALKVDPAPILVERTEIPPAIIDYFEAPATGATGLWPMGPKLAPTLGAGRRIAVLETPDVGPGGPMPGTRHPLAFAVASWPGGSPSLDVTEPGLDAGLVGLYAHSAMVWALEPRGYGRPVPLGVEALTAPGSPAVWASRWAWPSGPTLVEIRPLVADLAAAFGCPVLVDDRDDVVYFGAIGSPDLVWADPEATWDADLEWLATEDIWDERWRFTLKTGANPPVAQRATRADFTLAEGGTVSRQAFLARNGIDPGEYRGLEAKLASAIDGAGYVAICGWPVKGDRPGERHPQALAVYWSAEATPSVSRLRPSEAARLVIAGAVNAAFDAAKLARPELISARCLSAPDAQRSTWQISLRLYGGLSSAEVRSRQARIAGSLGVAWLRVDDGPGGATIYAGEPPGAAELADPAEADRLVALDWAAAWRDSGVVGAAGDLPALVERGKLAGNALVETLDFAVPPGVSRDSLRAGLHKLADATGNAWMDLRPSPHGAGHYRILASETVPIPTLAPVDPAATDTSAGMAVAFAVGIEGVPVVLDPASTPHALVVGATGSGKSSVLASLVYGFAAKGARVAIVDPIKGGADFAFARPWAIANAATLTEAQAVIRAIYDEVLARKDANAAAGVGSYRDLPEPPPLMVVLVDEFTSLVIPIPTKNILDEDDRAEAEAANLARSTIGSTIARIAREARSAGVVVLLATQKLTATLMESVPGGNDLKENLGRCLLGTTSMAMRFSALRRPEMAPELGDGDIPPGRGLWEPLTGGPQMIQAWYSPQAALAAALAARRPPLEAADRLDISRYLPEDRGRLVGGGHRAITSRSGDAGAPDDDEVVVDLGELSFSLADLEPADPELPEQAGEEEPRGEPGPPAAQAEPAQPAQTTGALSPPPPSGADPWAGPLDWGEPEPAATDAGGPDAEAPPVAKVAQADPWAELDRVAPQVPAVSAAPWDEPDEGAAVGDDPWAEVLGE